MTFSNDGVYLLVATREYEVEENNNSVWEKNYIFTNHYYKISLEKKDYMAWRNLIYKNQL